ncbi:MAG: Gfo/Idh/MocA family oxidoreductase [Candidatus Omnitrophica bacterium]|nr:Gfo/Idh/MocA family oxidoreductase [Candidatus Omnitrophota bacterium]
MNVLVVGLGSIGSRHARLFKEVKGVEVVALRQHGRGNTLGLREIRSWKEAAAFAPDVAVIAGPTNTHVASALRAARLGAHLFIEKPLSDVMTDVAALAALCRKKKRLCYVAYPLRFHPVVRRAMELLKGKKAAYARAACSSYLPDWRPGRPVTQTYSAQKRMGGGVILDLSHEFDYLSCLFGPVASIRGCKARVAAVTVDAEDTADALVAFHGGMHAAVHLNFMSRLSERWFHVDFKDGFLRGDLLGNTLRVVKPGTDRTETFSLDRDDLFRVQRDYFLSALRSGTIVNDISEAKNLLKKILEFRHA